MTATRTPQPAKVSPRAFTLLEAVVVLVVIGILSAVAVVGYNGPRRGQLDAGGPLILGVALVDGRMVAAVSGQTFPAGGELLASMASRAVGVNGTNVTYTSDGSKAPNSVSVAVGDANTAGYAVATSVDGTDVHCSFAVDSLLTGTTYAELSMTASSCTPVLVVTCPGDPTPAGASTAESPYVLTSSPPATCGIVPAG